ncbi:hypothetical protein NO2_0402 [Candidatus Termititenax persephonae]|uniref:Uncharacterized protein n=1 Tax=Candidatus Termititenax persephonae TaxID=2218525 RepID=A0A388TGH8_9BACT|nr:hypothetical protein NO2_0402 [Candidatus Termititenax persephonae]
MWSFIKNIQSNTDVIPKNDAMWIIGIFAIILGFLIYSFFNDFIEENRKANIRITFKNFFEGFITQCVGVVIFIIVLFCIVLLLDIGYREITKEKPKTEEKVNIRNSSLPYKTVNGFQIERTFNVGNYEVVETIDIVSMNKYIDTPNYYIIIDDKGNKYTLIKNSNNNDPLNLFEDLSTADFDF